jgi:hypothetical protein
MHIGKTSPGRRRGGEEEIGRGGDRDEAKEEEGEEKGEEET